MSIPDLTAAAEVLIAHTRVNIESCHCGWGSNTGHLGESHPLHVAQQLAEAGLTYDNTWLAENYQIASTRLAAVRELVEHREQRYAEHGGIRAVPVADLRRALDRHAVTHAGSHAGTEAHSLARKPPGGGGGHTPGVGWMCTGCDWRFSYDVPEERARSAWDRDYRHSPGMSGGAA